ncbi:hypothetical protein L1887_28023 [Cichorium endivia]|nr:hypothetical protein L1887_28023 [Cichorium endivia]
MELSLVTSIALAIVFFFLFKIATHHTSKKNLPPGPWGLPIIGHMHHLIGNEIRSSGSGRPINVSHYIYDIQGIVISRAALGKELKDTTEFSNLIKNIFIEMGGLDVIDIFPSKQFIHIFSSKRARIAKMKNDYENIVTKIFAERLNNQSSTSVESLLDILLRHKEGTEFPLTVDNVKAIIFDVFAGSVGAAGTTIEWALSELIRNPRVMEKLQTELRQVLNGKERIQEEDIQDLSYLNQVIKETLRLHPPAPFLIPRQSTEPSIFAGYDIPKKTKLLINAFAINRDPEYWKDPESYIPERFETNNINTVGADYEYLPFGAGRRGCPGVGLGLANVRLPLASMLYHFNWKLPNGTNNEDLDMSENYGISASRKYELFLVPTF